MSSRESLNEDVLPLLVFVQLTARDKNLGGLDSPILIISYCSNMHVKPKPRTIETSSKSSEWLAIKTHVITVLEEPRFMEMTFSVWHLGQHSLFSVHIKNGNFNLLRLIVFRSLDQRLSRRKGHGCLTVHGITPFSPQIKGWEASEESGVHLHAVYAEQWPLGPRFFLSCGWLEKAVTVE